MRLHVLEAGHAAFEVDSCLVVAIYEEPQPLFGKIVAERDRKTLERLAARGTIRGKAEETYYLATPESPYGGVLVIGLGAPGRFDAEVMRRAAGKAADELARHHHAHAVLDASSQDALPVEAFVERMRNLAATKLDSFRETVVGTEVHVFGNVAVALAACEITENDAGRSRGVEALLLIKDQGAWRIVSQAWDTEDDRTPIPAHLLGGQA